MNCGAQKRTGLKQAGVRQELDAGITGFNVWSLIVAVVGSIVVLWLYHQMMGRRSL